MSDEEELLKLEKEFTGAIVANDPGAIERFLGDDWIIINSNGGIIYKEVSWSDQIRRVDPRNDGV